MKKLFKLLAIVSMLFVSQAAFAFTNINCSTSADRLALGGGTTELDQADCEALDYLYTNTNPAGWTDNTGWDTSTDVDTWFGVTRSGTSVTVLDLENNNLVGAVPSLTVPANISFYNVRNNQLSGDISGISASFPTSMRVFRVDGNQLTGDLSGWDLSALVNLTDFFLTSNQFTGNLSGLNISNLPVLSDINISFNQFTGDLGAWDISNISTLESFSINNNQFTGDISVPGWRISNTATPALRIFNVSSNQFSGDFSSIDLSGMSSLTVYRINNNQLSGNLSMWTFTGLTSLIDFYIFNNQLTGNLSMWDITGLSSIKRFIISDNQFSGDISTAGWDITGLSTLERIILTRNQFSGDLTGLDLSGLSQLQIYNIDENMLSGDISSLNIAGLTSLLNINVAENDFTGDLSVAGWDISNLTSLIGISLRENRFTGDISGWTIPSTLEAFRVDNNAFSGDVVDLSPMASPDTTLTSLDFNAFETTGAAIDAANDAATGNNWSATQTRKPVPTIVQSINGNLTITDPTYEYTNTGDYTARIGTVSGGPYTVAIDTVARSAGTLSINGLAINTPYYGVMEAQTPANTGGNVITSTSDEFLVVIQDKSEIATASNDGVSNSDNVTSVTSPEMVGQCVNGATVELVIDNVATGDTAVCAGGTYSITPATPLVTGTSYSVQTSQTIGGNTSTLSPTLTLVIDNDGDNDGVPDSTETAESTDSSRGTVGGFLDSDGDLVPDFVERNDGTDINNPASFKDTDMGGTPDYVETILFPNSGLNVTDPGTASDDSRNSDGQSPDDYNELRNGTNPLARSGGGGGSSPRVCRDQDASNYSQYGRADNSLCRYDDDRSDTNEGNEDDSEDSGENNESDSVAENNFDSLALVFTKNISLGNVANDRDEVNRIITFLNENEGESLALDGSYDQDDMEAVMRFQKKYEKDVLSIWGLSEPTGFVGITTRLKMNLLSNTLNISCPAFVEFNSLTRNNNSSEVARTKSLLRGIGFYNGDSTALFNRELDAAVKRFQQTFSTVMLRPWGLTRGTGYKYQSTNKFMNFLAGCNTRVTLDNGVTLDY